MPFQSEEEVHKEIMEGIEKIGWENGNKLFGIKEHSFIENVYFPDILEKKIKEINKEIFEELTPSEEKYVMERIYEEMKNAGEEKILEYLKYGIKIVVNEEVHIIRLLDYSNKNNLFFYLHEAKFRGSPENSKPDFTLYINGIPIITIEAKSEAIPDSHYIAIRQIRGYEMKSSDLFRFVQFGVGYGDEKKYTPTFPNWERKKRNPPIFNWAVREGNIRKENIFDLLLPEKVLEFIKYFIFFIKPKEGEMSKLMARQNQYRATKKAINRIRGYMDKSDKNRGLIWHWQGSGKTYTMFFIANYFLDLYFDTHPVIFFIVDRTDLERQHERVIKGVQDIKFKGIFKKIEKITELEKLIETMKESGFTSFVIKKGIYLTTIQKFQRGKVEEGLNEKDDRKAATRLYSLLLKLAEDYLEHLKKENPEEYQKHIQKLESLEEKKREEYLLNLGGIHKKNILLLIDEAHRSQYNLLGAMRKACFPASVTFGFTGTPIFKNERNTFLEFSYPDEGEYYLDVYFIGESIDDKFTLPITYYVVKEGEIKAEGVKIKLTEKEIADFIKEYMEKKGGIENILEARITRKEIGKHITKAKVILLNKERIDKLSKYIVDRIEEDTEDFKYKAMVVAVNRVGCVRYKKTLDKYLLKKFGKVAKNWTEIVMTYNYNDNDPEIVEYKEELMKRRKNNDANAINEEIVNDFLEKEEPKILIVTDMLLTGFDAPMLKVMYLDKPLYAHRLLQAIARVNRPFNDKETGLIVDSFGLMEHLAKTMAIYNLLAEDTIKKDFEMNLMESINQKFSELEQKFKSIKKELKDLKIEGEDVGIDFEKVRESLSTGKGKEDIQARLSMIAMYIVEDKAFSAKIIRLINDVRATLKIYKALGAYQKKILYTEDIEVLAYIYYKLRVMLKGRRKLGKEFWDELRSYIHRKTIIEEFKEVGKTKITSESLKGITKELADEEEIRKKAINVIADYFFNLRAALKEKIYDPIYRQILEKIEKLRIEWITRTINTKEFLSKLRVINDDLEAYNKKIEGKSKIDKLMETLSYYIYQNTKREITLENTKKTLEKIQTSKIKMFIPDYKKETRTSLLKDMLKSIQDVKKVETLADELIEYVEKEMMRIWKS
ncbi:MAG TPA: HsdR family type I site-specific deoxyribonuclease [Thermoplasmata archaeon]|nr:HsdR family type I site-specific deoxyribonuclease [Thermoplasmata archaeon]